VDELIDVGEIQNHFVAHLAVFLYLVHHFLVQGVLNFRIGGQHVRGIGQCERRRVETGQQEQDSLYIQFFSFEYQSTYEMCSDELLGR